MSTKEAVIEMIRRMPDDATLPDIMEELYVRQKIDEGLRQLDAGEGIPHEEVERRLAKWLN
jgi:predicted transcriptional regulator